METGFNGFFPKIAKDVWIDPFTRLIGNITLKEGASIWPGVVLRADDSEIVIGRRSAILDLSLLESPFGHPVVIDDEVLISHKVCIHGASIEKNALIGIGAIVLEGAVVQKGALVGAGAIVPSGMKIPPYTLALGQPAKIIRQLTESERKGILIQIQALSQKAATYRRMSS
mgnify:CR=1 FL=1|jgi:carbonic anhydrase/acetyltransferase-like protein (isoleucine patch superfamily)